MSRSSMLLALVVVSLLLGIALLFNSSTSGQIADVARWAPAGSPADAGCDDCHYIWSAKYICLFSYSKGPFGMPNNLAGIGFPKGGLQKTSSKFVSSHDHRVADTWINIHNPLEQKAVLTWKVVPVSSILVDDRAKPSKLVQVVLGPNEAVQVNCNAIFTQLGRKPTPRQFEEGFVAIHSDAPLVVAAVYRNYEGAGSFIGESVAVRGDAAAGVGLGIGGAAGIGVSIDAAGQHAVVPVEHRSASPR